MNKYANPIAQVGSVKLADGSNKMFGNISNCWAFDSKTTALLFINLYQKTPYKWKVVVTADTFESTKERYKLNEVQSFKADQSGRNLGEWVLTEVVEWSLEGLKRIADTSGKKSVMMATYK
jgi:hypothetical protein